MKVGVTGASGFVGRYVVAQLLSRGIAPHVAGRRIPPALEGAANHFAEVDISAPPEDAFEQMGSPDVVIHLAWGGLPNYQSLHHCVDELPAQFRFLRQLIMKGLKHLLVTGTCLEYGMQYGPLHEDMPEQPNNPYALAKSVLRRQLVYLQRDFSFTLTWARLFYLFGEGQAPTSLLSQLAAAVERSDKTFNMTAGEQLRDYLPVTAAAEYLVNLALQGRDHGVVNVCSARPVSVRSLVERWIEDNSWTIALNRGHHPYPAYEPLAFWGDRRKLNLCLGIK